MKIYERKTKLKSVVKSIACIFHHVSITENSDCPAVLVYVRWYRVYERKIGNVDSPEAATGSVLCKKVSRKTSQNSEKITRRSISLEACNFVKKSLRRRFCPLNFPKCFRTALFTETPSVAASVVIKPKYFGKFLIARSKTALKIIFGESKTLTLLKKYMK